MGMQDKIDFVRILNSLGLLFICVILAAAYYFQFVDNELPCPLCLLQRLGLILAGCGFFFNLRMGCSFSNYSLVIFSAIFTSCVAVRQVLLHIMPGDPGYGSVFLGFHFYTWSLITSIFIIMIVAGIMILNDLSNNLVMPKWLKYIKKCLSAGSCVLFALLIVTNLIFGFLECGFNECPADPKTYTYLLN